MDVNRNQWLLAGLVVLLLGIQIRVTKSIVLTPEFTKILAERSGNPVSRTDSAGGAGDGASIPGKTVVPPQWLGWCLLSVGSVLILHSLGMKRPD